MVGAGTVRKDDPRLTDRSGISPAAPLVRVIVGHDGQVLAASQILKTAREIPTIFACAGPSSYLDKLNQAGIEVWHWPDQADVPLEALCRRLSERGIDEILLEGGAHLAAAMLKAGLIHTFQLILAPKLLGQTALSQAILQETGCTGPSTAYQLIQPELTLLGDNVLYTATLSYKEVDPCSPD